MEEPAARRDDGGSFDPPRPVGPPPAGQRVRPTLLLALLTVVLAYSLAAALYLRSLADEHTAAGLRLAGQPIGGLLPSALPAAVAAIGEAALDEPVTLTIGPDRVRATRRELGLTVDVTAMVAEAARVGRTGNPLADLRARRAAARGQLDLRPALSLDPQRALEALTDLKDWLDRAPVDAHLDLEHHAVAAERPGHLLLAYEAEASLVALARSGAARADLPVEEVAARVVRGDLTDIDIDAVLGAWETHYSTLAIDSDRTYNLKVGASKLDGHILKPHEVFSFNEVVGERTEKQGYRVAPVISSGELIDGLAGGMCQIASTLHAAAFFAGLDIVSSTPHSRPSAYIPMGLDATVVWPSTDLKLRNPFDFPVVVHYSVNQGAVRVELLGKRAVYHTVFEREILEEHAFGASVRRDREWPSGQKYVAQEGYPGYHAIRRRYLLDAATALPRWLGGPTDPLERTLAARHITPLRVEKWTVHYPATEQIVAYGAGAREKKKRDPPPSHHIPAVAKDQKPLGRIVR